MNILHINSYFNGSTFYKNLFDEQDKMGLNISVYVPAYKVIDPSTDFGDYTKISINHHKLDRVFFHLKHKKIFSDIFGSYDFKKISLIHAHSLFSNGYIALKLKRKFGIPYIVAVRNTDVNWFFKYMIHLRKIGIEIMKESEKVFFLSNTYRDFVIYKYVPKKFRKLILNKTMVIPNGIDDFWFQNKGSIKVPKKSSLKLLYVGVINKNKNLLTTIKAIEVLRKNINVEYTIVGKIVDSKICKKIKNLPYVKYIEPLPKEKLINIYRSNDIFVMPSYRETFGLVYPEAMSQGLPVIYSKGQGFDGQFDEGVIGYSVNSKDPNDIANKIIKILNSYKEISERCLIKVQKFNWKEINYNYLKQYKSICNKEALKNDAKNN